MAQEEDVVVAYVFGSAARGTLGESSDVDVAVLLVPDHDPRRRLQLSAAVQAVMAPRRVDLVLLNDAPPSLAFRVLRDGRQLVCADPQAAADHREEVLRRYLDLEPLRRELRRGLYDRVLEGRFGR